MRLTIDLYSLTNLLTNSIKFTSNGYVKLAAHIVAQTIETTTVSFSVKDTGIGIEDDVKARLFKPFSQADSSTARRFGGTGLGLTISNNLVDLMHGQIALESQPATGTLATFSIPFNKPQFMGTSTPMVALDGLPERLQSELSLSCDHLSQGGNFAATTSIPFYSPKQKAMPSTAAEKGSAVSPSKAALEATEMVPNAHHILIVEDNAINQQIAIRTIRIMGYSVSAVWNGREALEYLLKAMQSSMTQDATNQTDHYRLPSLILMDVQMPILDGYRATHTLRHHAPYNSNTLIQNIPIVAMTASAIQGDRERCQRAGMNDYLAKPVKRTTLEKMIHKWISSENRLGTLSTSMKPAEEDSVRPDLCRNGTEGSHRSSNCPGPDYQIVEAKINDTSLASRRMSIAQSTSTPVSMGQGEDAADRGQRLAAAAEMAASLRDAKLVNAATDTHEHGASILNGSLGTTTHQALAVGHGHEAYPNQHQHGSSLALTEENIKKLNAKPADDRVAMLQATPSAAGRLQDQVSEAVAVTIEPSGAMIPSITVGGASATPIIDSPIKTSPTESRRGQLSTSDRKQSDWSNATTVKPLQE